jgi:NAD dependent epimerase/dehydratase
MTDHVVMVTGAGGFIGSHLTELLLSSGMRVRALLRYTSHKHKGWLGRLPRELSDGLEIIYGDVQDARSVRNGAHGCSRIYHLAALVSIPYSYVAPVSYIQTNVQGTLNVLEAARDLDVDRVVITSTSEVYGTARYTPIDEGHPLQAQSPYSASKVGADHLALSYHRSFGLPVTLVRPFNTYGPRQSTRAIIPTIMVQILKSDRVEIGNLDPVRDFVFVGDTAAGFVALADCEACVGRVTNLATGTGVTMRTLVSMIMGLAGRELPVVEEEIRKRPETSEVFELKGQATAARELAGWEAKISLEEGLRFTLEWIRENVDSYDTGTYEI